MNTELLTENWYKFTRIYCKEGYIDRWMGDCFHNPNEDTKPRLCGNMSSTYYRLGIGKWYHKENFKIDFMTDLAYLSDAFTANELWRENYTPDERKLHN